MYERSKIEHLYKNVDKQGLNALDIETGLKIYDIENWLAEEKTHTFRLNQLL